MPPTCWTTTCAKLPRRSTSCSARYGRPYRQGQGRSGPDAGLIDAERRRLPASALGLVVLRREGARRRSTIWTSPCCAPISSWKTCARASSKRSGRLYGLTFKPNGPTCRSTIPDVKAYEVLDRDGSTVAIWYSDYFPRASKRGGAWMDALRKEYYRTESG